MSKYENEKLEFAVNVPEVVTLDTEPTQAKEYSKTFKNEDGTDYVSKSYMYFAKGKLIFFAPEKLQDYLLTYKKGDTVTITKMQAPGERAINWKVDKGAVGGGERQEESSSAIKELGDKIDRLSDLIIKVLNEKNPSISVEPVQVKETTTESDEDLGF